MRFGFVTCVRLGLQCMETIYEVGGTLDLVITLPDDVAKGKAGRIWPDQFCNDHDIPLLKVRHVNDSECISAIRDYGLDWLFIIGWSQIAGPQVLDAPHLGVLGMHPTLLPVGRGRAAIPWAILLGLPETGVTMFKLDRGVDTGPIIAQERLALTDQETATSLYDRVGDAHRRLLQNTWDDLVHGRVTLREQDETKATEWPGRRPDDGLLTAAATVDEADRLVRATTRPYPGAFWREPDRILRIWAGSKSKPERAASIDLSAASDHPPPFRLVLADGDYYATEYGNEEIWQVT